MYIPKNIVAEVAKRFYDKEVTILSVDNIVEPDGGIKKSLGKRSTLLGNVKFNAFGLAQNEIGQTIDADIIITCATSEDIGVNDYLEYEDSQYLVTEVLPYDSHLTIYGKACP